MKTLTKALLATGILLATALPTYAHEGGRTNGLSDRLERQQTRIEHGVDNRELTRHEVKNLKKQHRRLRHLAREFREDGRLTKKERRKLDRRLDRISENIWELKHNDVSRHRKSDHRYSYDWHDDSGWSHHRHSHQW